MPQYKEAQALAERLEKSGRPVVSIEMRDVYDLGAQYFIWETATAAAGSLMKINPFDQPNVQEAKTLAQAALRDIATKKGAEAEPKSEIRLSAALSGAVTTAGLGKFLTSTVKDGDYVGIMAYMDGSAETDKALELLRRKFNNSATLFGYGPRYLHSTGQLHKGGANNGVFLMFTAAPAKDAPVPTENYTFAQLEYAQAGGDFAALDAKGRRAVWVHLGAEPLKTLAEITDGFGNK